jgi:glycine/D-amino acid oxidase-like deaminating enzyme
MHIEEARMARVAIVGGGIMGASLAYWLTEMGHPPGEIAVVERDPSYARAATSLTNSCIRQQFGNPLNVAISRFGVEYLRDFPARTGDPRVPPVAMHAFGYLYLAGDAAQAERLRAAHAVQVAAGAGTLLLTPDEIAARWPFYDLDGVVLGSWGARDEGYFDGGTLFEWWRRLARERGVAFHAGEAAAVGLRGGRARGVTLACGAELGADIVVLAAGTRTPALARTAGIALPVEPRRRHTWVFQAEAPPTAELPLTIDPSGLHVRSDGAWFMAGAAPDPDPAVDPDDFAEDHALWEAEIWPRLAARIPAFAAVRLRRSWVGHYDLNTLDANAVIGPHPACEGLWLMTGFSGHGLQQAPAMGRGLAERIVHGRYVTLDLGPFGCARLETGTPFPELAVI